MSTMNQENQSADEVREVVRQRYAEVAERKEPCCGANAGGDARAASHRLGYSADTLDSVPADANLGLGCGNPTALASLQPGEVVVDLGAGAGLDALVAARAVGPEGRVIGVDMTQAMLTSARKNAVEMGVHGYVEFREGLIEALPVADSSADVVISNCVINLSPDKAKTFEEAYRVLKPSGRLAVSDIVLSEPLPAAVANMVEAYVACIAGASTEDDYLGAMREAGFVDIEYTRVPAGSLFLDGAADPLIEQAIAAVGRDYVERLASTVWSYKITARKP